MPSLIRALSATLMLVVTLSAVPLARAADAPCIAASTVCTTWVTLGGGPARSLVYTTRPLDARSERVKRALVVIHGLGRNADNYFRSAVAAAFLADALEDTIVIAPRFAANDGAACKDVLAADEINWTCTGRNWRAGGTAAGAAGPTSFDLADEILRRLTRKDVFPLLASIVVAGHSAGGQFVTRYQMANQVDGALGVPVTYVVANPSAHPYLDNERPVAASADYRPYADGVNCTTFDNWPYGLKDRWGYAAKIGDEQLRKQLLARPVTYLLGGLDTLPLAGFDASCPAMAQGPHRLGRGQAFAAYLKQRYATEQKVVVVALCGHNARCMFTADPALPVLFPKP